MAANGVKRIENNKDESLLFKRNIAILAHPHDLPVLILVASSL